jgi:hypothetical protein
MEMSVELDASRGLTRANDTTIHIEKRRYNVYLNRIRPLSLKILFVNT